MNEQSLVTQRERRITYVAALIFIIAMLLGAVLWGNRMRMLFAITNWQDNAGWPVNSSGTIKLDQLGCPLALEKDESGSITAKATNEWTREVQIEFTFYTEDLSNGPPYSYIFHEPICGPEVFDVPPHTSIETTCDFTDKVVSKGGIMPLSVRARTIYANFGPRDYSSMGCPIWIVNAGGLSGNWVVNGLGLLSLIGMALSGIAWGIWGYVPNIPRWMFLVGLLWLAGVIIALGMAIYAIHEVISCGFLAGIVIFAVLWIATRDRRRQPIQSIFEQS